MFSFASLPKKPSSKINLVILGSPRWRAGKCKAGGSSCQLFTQSSTAPSRGASQQRCRRFPNDSQCLALLPVVLRAINWPFPGVSLEAVTPPHQGLQLWGRQGSRASRAWGPRPMLGSLAAAGREGLEPASVRLGLQAQLPLGVARCSPDPPGLQGKNTPAGDSPSLCKQTGAAPAAPSFV